MTVFWGLLSVGALSAEDGVNFPAATVTIGGAGGDGDELPAHTVTLDGFTMDRTEVSLADYMACVKSGRCSPPHFDDGKCYVYSGSRPVRAKAPAQLRDPREPVVCVSWDQAKAYCRSKGKRLPTEAEWERAAHAGSSNPYAWGTATPSEATCAQANEHRPRNCGTTAPNASGLFDMTGNVWEWVEDRYDPAYYQISPDKNPKGPAVGRYRVIRGGGWYTGARELRINNRQWFAPEAGEVSVGFRCVK